MRTKQQFVQQFVAPCLEPLGTLNGSWGALGEPSLKNAIKTDVFKQPITFEEGTTIRIVLPVDR